MRTRTNVLDGVTNGSPWFGRSKAIRRLTHGSQRYRSMTPLAFVNSQFEPVRLLRSVAEYRIRTTVARRWPAIAPAAPRWSGR